MDLEALIKLIRNDPTKYLSRHSLHVLSAFIDGWQYRNFTDDVKITLLENFTRWINDYYQVNYRNHWKNIILYFSKDDYTALDNFFELWDKFLFDEKKRGLPISRSQDSLEKESKTENYIVPNATHWHDIKDIINLIDIVKKKPPMFLGYNSLILLKSYIEGWYFRNPSKDVQMELLNRDFHVYLQKYFQMDNRSSWDRKILYYQPDDALALNFFFELWSKFLTKKG